MHGGGEDRRPGPETGAAAIGGPYERHELPELASTAVTQSYLVIVLGMTAQFLTELFLRRSPGFADDSVTDLAVRVLGVAVVALVAYVVHRLVPAARMRPFVQATAIAVGICGVLGRCAYHTGGGESPYVVSLGIVLFCFSLIMPGGARYAAPALIGGYSAFYGVLIGSEGGSLSAPRSLAFALFVGSGIFFAVVYAEVLERWRRRVSTASTTDGLTDLLSRAYLLERVATLSSTARSDERPLSLLMLDVDHFKKVNDTYGHPAGDEVLRRVAAVLRAATRANDACGRMGGEEFLLVLDGCDEQHAFEVGERVRKSVEALEFESDGRRFRITVSAGVAQIGHGRFSIADEALRAADRALYESKAEGRNRIRIAKSA
ncbi:MAG: GGDEF domain-containing protein [Polyangiales bacterium]